MKHEIVRKILGYAISVLTAAAATVAIVTAGERSSFGNFLFLLLFGMTYIVTCGLPGFALTLVLARKFRLRHAAFFALAGGANAVLAWLALYVVTGDGVRFAEPLFRASIAGGIAGGLAYWSIAVRRTGRRPEPA